MSHDDDNGYPTSPADKQKAVNDMAVAIAAAEMLAERMCVEAGKLAADVRKFRKGCGLHAMMTAEAQRYVGEAMSCFGGGYESLAAAHRELTGIVEHCSLPEPGPVPTGGGGGGK